MDIRTTGIIGRTSAVRINSRKWAGTLIDTTDPSHSESQVRSSSIAWFWSYSLPKVILNISKIGQSYVLLDSVPVSSVKQLSVTFLQHWEAPRPCCCTPTFRSCNCLEHWGALLSVKQGHSIYDRTVDFVFFFAIVALKYLLAWRYGYQWIVQVLSRTTVQVRCLYVVAFQR